MVQDIGSVATINGRCIAFPNIYQHRVAPLQLEDPTRPGMRRILVFFLVDPNKRIRSTATVPPQQFEIVSECFMKISKFPNDVTSKILEFVSGVMHRDTAEFHREELMKERKYIDNEVTGAIFERPFSLCEH